MADEMQPPIRIDRNLIVGRGRKRGEVNTAGSVVSEERGAEV
jgi:hypothetical protein